MFLELKDKGFEAVGTVRSDRKGIPKEFQKLSLNESNKLKNGYKLTSIEDEADSVMICDNKIRCLKWRDKQVVNILSTYHDADMITKERTSRSATKGTETIN